MSLAAEQTYFDGYHFKHIADYYEKLRQKRKSQQNRMLEDILVRKYSSYR